MKEFRALIKREILSLGKEKTLLLAIAVQLIIALLSASILEGVLAFYDPEFIGTTTGSIRIGITGEQDNQLAFFLDGEKISVTRYSDYSAAEQAFLSGRIDAFLVFSENQEKPVDLNLYLPEHESRKTAVLLVLDSPLKKYENYLREQDNIQLNYRSLTPGSFSPYEFFYTVLIPLLMLFPGLVAGSMVIDTISEEFENKTIDTLLSAHVSSRQVFTSKIFVAAIAAILQIFLWTGILSWNGILIQHIPLVITLAVSYAVSVSFGSSVIAILFKDRQRSQFMYSMILITVGTGSYFLGTSPIEMLTKLSSGAPEINYSVYLLYALFPLVVLTVFFSVSKSGKQ